MDTIKYSAYQKRLESDVLSGKSGQIRTRDF